MSFCSFSKEVDDAYTVVDNKFITKYLPETDGFAVKVYLYGLYLCANAENFTLHAMAEILKTTDEKLMEAFEIWQDYDLVEIISKDPFTVQYLPVHSAIGKPKKVRYEKYTDFNKELQRKMQKVGKFIAANDYIKYMRFLEEQPMQPQAFLLVAEYCINKQGEAVAPAYIFNKAKKLVKCGCLTFDQVEEALSNYNAHEGEVIAVYNAMAIYQRTPEETDYTLYAKWTEKLGFAKDAILAAAKRLKKKNISSLDLVLEELAAKNKLTAKEVEGYLLERETLVNLTFRLGEKLGVKVQNPAPYVEEYTEKWYNYGFEEGSLSDLAAFCFKTERGSFEGLGKLLEDLFRAGEITADSVKRYLKEQNAELKLFHKIQEYCGNLRRSVANLSMLKTWREWSFDEKMILEAAKRSGGSTSPLPYMNKILSDWKQSGIFSVENIPETKGAGTSSSQKSGNFRGGFVSAAVEAADAKSAREKYYAEKRERAISRAEKYLKKANANARFKEITTALSKMEFDLAKAEMYAPENLPALQTRQSELLVERGSLLQDMGIAESDLLPKFECARCEDTGFLPSGVACSCYRSGK